MVIEDFNSDLKQQNSKTFYPADPVERMFSFLLDMAFLSPLISLACAYHFQQIVLDESENFQSSLWISMVVTGFFTSISLQSLFLYFYEATPGQAFLSLKVKSVEAEKLTWGACFLRSIVFHISCVLFFLPFIECFTHRLGRCMHDKISDTMTVQLEAPKFKYLSETAAANIKKFSFLASFFVVLILLSAFSVDPFLPTKPKNVSISSIDQAVSKALLLRTFDESTELAMNQRLWTAKNAEERNLIYYYQFHAAKDRAQKKFIAQKICQQNLNLFCELTELSLAENPVVNPLDWKLEKMNLTESVGLMREAALKANFALAFQIHEYLLKDKKISDSVKAWDAALLIQAQKTQPKSRKPASSENDQTAIDKFKVSRGEL